MESDKFIAERLLEVISDGEGGFQELVSLVRKDRRQKTQLTEKDTRIAELEHVLNGFVTVHQNVDQFSDELLEQALVQLIVKSIEAIKGESNHVANLEEENTRMQKENELFQAELKAGILAMNDARYTIRILREALSKCEWVFYPVNESGSSSMCPLCENEIIEGHKSDCEMETILKETLNEFKP